MSKEKFTENLPKINRLSSENLERFVVPENLERNQESVSSFSGAKPNVQNTTTSYGCISEWSQRQDDWRMAENDFDYGWEKHKKWILPLSAIPMIGGLLAVDAYGPIITLGEIGIGIAVLLGGIAFVYRKSHNQFRRRWGRWTL